MGFFDNAVERGDRILAERQRRKAAGEPKMGFLEERSYGKNSAPPGPTREAAWCPNCKQNVRPVRRAKAGKLLATGLIGFGLTKPTMCPICKTEELQAPRNDAAHV